LEAAGFPTLGYLETNSAARESLRANRPNWKALTPADVIAAAKRLTPSSLGLRRKELAMLAGAPPCQPFSKAAQWSHRSMRGLLDPRADCVMQFLRIAEIFLPRVILMENVEGFAMGRTTALPAIERCLARINRKNDVCYKLQTWIIDAADFGVPQHRRRAILFAERSGQLLEMPPKTHGTKRITAWDALWSFPQLSQEDSRAPEGWLELLPSIPEGHNYLWHTRRGGGEPLFGYRTRYWSFLLKLAKNRPSWTLPAQPGPYTGPFHWTGRDLSEAEMLRLQSFPANWKVEGTRRERARQIGNATPPLLAEVVGRAIRQQVFGHPDAQGYRLAIKPSRLPCPAAEALSPIPAKFRKMIGFWPDHPGTGRGPRPILSVKASNGKAEKKYERKSGRRRGHDDRAANKRTSKPQRSASRPAKPTPTTVGTRQDPGKNH
jgi:DNA (cytosine-5)-methyltransferase 1